MSLLGPHWESLRILDCFAGSGAFGFEALSRGARSVTFLEKDRRAGDAILQTAATLDLRDRIQLHRGDALAVLPRLSDTFDVLFFDPPYGMGLLEPALTAAQALGSPGAHFVAEHDAKHVIPATIGDLTSVDQRQYGSTQITVYAARKESI